ncbi:MAG: preprotein translocase subunit YajC [Bifidobacteriaceae bacterium]|jgi:preprotein translocase subunit YajC|nr:preprotein translocase subunit YajC [Bifidobacteriaceae bacterium]
MSFFRRSSIEECFALTIHDAVLLATEENPPTGGGGSQYVFLIFIVGMIALMWFMSRRNKKQQQQQGDFRRTLDVGQRVMTVGGMIGVISQVQGDVVTLMSPGGDETAYVRRAIKSQVSDEEWTNLTEPYPVDEEAPADEVSADAVGAADAASAPAADDVPAGEGAEAAGGEEPEAKDG